MTKQEITTVLADLHRITGFRISLHGSDYKEIAAYPEERHSFCQAVNELRTEHEKCIECDRAACIAALKKRDTYVYRCRYGLTEAVSPLYNFGMLTGFLMMGQVADSETDAKVAVAMLKAMAKGKRNVNRLAIDSAEIPVVDARLVRSYMRIMTICAQYLTLSNAISGAKPSAAELAKKYITDNISTKFTIADICKTIKCSKSTLLTSFKKKYGITVNNYIIDQRLTLSRHMLTESETSISEISAATGFTDQSYFSKVFSAKYGITPREYRERVRQDEPLPDAVRLIEEEEAREVAEAAAPAKAFFN